MATSRASSYFVRLVVSILLLLGFILSGCTMAWGNSNKKQYLLKDVEAISLETGQSGNLLFLEKSKEKVACLYEVITLTKGELSSGETDYLLAFYNFSGDLLSTVNLKDALGQALSSVLALQTTEAGEFWLGAIGEDSNDIQIFLLNSEGILKNQVGTMPIQESINYKIAFDKDGIGYCLVEGDTTAPTTLYVSKPEGQTVQVAKLSSKVNYSLFYDQNKLYLLGVSNGDDPRWSLDRISHGRLEAMIAEAPVKQPGSCYWIQDQILWFVNQQGLYQYPLDSMEMPTAELLWKDVGSIPNWDPIRHPLGLADNNAFIFSGATDQGISVPSILTQSSLNPEIKKQTLVVAGVNLENAPFLQEVKAEFEKLHPTVTLTLRDYYLEQDSEDKEAVDKAIQQLQMDILAEQPPDIIIGDYDFKENQELFADLLPYLKADSQFTSENYLDNMLYSEQKDGRLYALHPFFWIDGLVGDNSLLGDRKSWTFADFDAWVKTLPPEMKPIQNVSHDTLLENTFAAQARQYIDFEKGQVNLQQTSFYELLDFCREYNTDHVPYDDAMVLNKDYALWPQYFSSVEEYIIFNTVFNAHVSFVGYPGGHTESARFRPTLTLQVIKSKNQDLAWDFAKIYLSDLIQGRANEHYGTGFPILRQAITEDIKRSQKLKDIYTDGITIGTITLKSEDFKPLTEAEIANLWQILEATDKAAVYDDKIFAILNQETEAFFAGDKTAQAVAKIAEDRIKTYLTEKK